MAQAKAKASGAESASPIIARTPAMRRTLDNIEALGLTSNLLELEVQGFTVIPGVLSDDRITRAKAAIVRRVEKQAKRKVDPDTAQPEDFHGMQYQPYLLFDDPVFSEILLEPKPLALITYLLGESCILSSMGCHFRGPGGLPLAVHADGVRDDCKTPSSLVANCNYALTPYTQEAGAVVLFPGSHRRLRQPTPHENWTTGGKTILEVSAEKLPPRDLDAIEWQIPKGGVTMEINAGDAVVWHGNSWHGGWRRELPGARINLAAYFCRDFMSTQELRGDERYPEVFERYANEPRFAQLLGKNVYNGWREEGPNRPRG